MTMLNLNPSYPGYNEVCVIKGINVWRPDSSEEATIIQTDIYAVNFRWGNSLC